MCNVDLSHVDQANEYKIITYSFTSLSGHLISLQRVCLIYLLSSPIGGELLVRRLPHLFSHSLNLSLPLVLIIQWGHSQILRYMFASYLIHSIITDTKCIHDIFCIMPSVAFKHKSTPDRIPICEKSVNGFVG